MDTQLLASPQHTTNEGVGAMVENHSSIPSPIPVPKNVADITGKRFGRLVVIRYAGKTKSKSPLTLWLCLCDCGREYVVRAKSLSRGLTKSCGCLRKDMPRSWIQKGSVLRGKPLIVRFWEKVDICSHGAACVDCCWRWKGFLSKDGYGFFRVASRDGPMSKSHHIAYMLCHGEILVGYEIDHICRTRDCHNPAHLESVTHAENNRRAALRRICCKNGHIYTAETSYVEVRKTGKQARICLICKRNYARRFVEKMGGWKGVYRHRVSGNYF